VRVLITECTRTVFYSQLQAVNEGSGATVSVDARPSDAINLAIRLSVPIYLHKAVVQEFAKRLS
jgi:bifunctional DNase/RNase